MNDPGKVVILGAGPTGLGAATRFAELGHTDFVVLEAGPEAGGLARSVVDEHGYTWDIGGHVQFSHYREYDEALHRALGDAWLEHERESWIWIDRRWVPYPFQYNLHRLQAANRDRALDGLERASAMPGIARPQNFQDWIRSSFGDGIAELFLLPYNQKVWGYPLDELGVDWIGERVAAPDLERVRRNIAAARDDVSWGPNNRFRFPARGGTGAIWKAVSRLLPAGKLRLGQRVEAIDVAARNVRCADGASHRWDALISTLPIDRACHLIEPRSVALAAAAGKLRHSSVHVLGIGLRGELPESLRRKCWMYFPEDHSPYYRVTVFSNYSPQNVPDIPGAWSLMAEVCESPAKPVDHGALFEWTISALRHDGLIPESTEVVSRWHHREEYGYPTPFLGRDALLRPLLLELENLGIYSRGRFGAWTYEVSNQDHSFMQGFELVDRLLLGRPEKTLRILAPPSS